MTAVGPGVDQLQRRGNVGGRGVHVVGGDLTRDLVWHEGAIEHERELDLDLRVDVGVGTQLGAGWHEHVVEQRTEIRFVDVHRHLHRPAGQPDLVAEDLRAVGDLPVHPGGLDRVGVLEGDVGKLTGDRVDRRDGATGLLVVCRNGRDLFVGERPGHQTRPSFGIGCVP